MKKIWISVLVVALSLPLTPLFAVDTISNVEIIRFADVTLRTSDMQPIPVVLLPSHVTYAEPYTDLLVELTLDNPAPRDFIFFYSVDGRSIERVRLQKGEQDVSLPISVPWESRAVMAEGGSMIKFSGDPEEVGFESRLTGSFDQSGSIMILPSTEAKKASLLLQIEQLQQILKLLQQIKAAQQST